MLLKTLAINDSKKNKLVELEFHGPAVQTHALDASGKIELAQSVALSLDDSTNVLQSLLGGPVSFIMKHLTDAAIIDLLLESSDKAEEVARIDAQIKALARERDHVGNMRTWMNDIEPVEKALHPDPIDELLTEKEAAQRYIKDISVMLNQISDTMKTFRVECDADIVTVTDYLKRKRADLKAWVKAQPRSYIQADIDMIDQQIARWGKKEALACAYDAYRKHLSDMAGLEAQYAQLGKQIQEKQKERLELLQNATFPIDDLLVNENYEIVYFGAVRGITEEDRSGKWTDVQHVLFDLVVHNALGEKIIVLRDAESLSDEQIKSVSNWADEAGVLLVLVKTATESNTGVDVKAISPHDEAAPHNESDTHDKGDK